MTHRALLLGLSALAFAAAAFGQRAPVFDDADETRAALAAALEERRAAEARSERLEAEAALIAAARASDQPLHPPLIDAPPPLE